MKLKKILSSALAIVMLTSMSISVYANDATPESYFKEFITADEMDSLSTKMGSNLVSNSNFVEVRNINLSTDIVTSSINELGGVTEESFVAKERGTWKIVDKIFNGTGQLTSTNAMDMYILETTSNSAPALKITASNPNLLVQLFILDPDTGMASATKFMDTSGDEVAQIAGELNAGHYILAVGSSSGTETGSYKLMWNCSNPSNPTKVLYGSSNLDLVTLGYGYQDIKSNGNILVQQHLLEWEESYTFNFGTGHRGRDQSIKDVDMRYVKMHYGSYKTNKYSTNNALFVQVGRGTSWSIMQSYYSNVEGNVTHEMNRFDSTGQLTPRRLDAIDEQIANHYLVIDLEKNLIVDFFSPYNYLWQSGETTGGGTINLWDI